MTRDPCPQHDPDLVPDLLAVNEYLRQLVAELKRENERLRERLAETAEAADA